MNWTDWYSWAVKVICLIIGLAIGAVIALSVVGIWYLYN